MRIAPRSALYLPASNARAIEKARSINADMVILDLEDSVKEQDKAAAREAAVAAAAAGFGHRIVAIRINALDSGHHRDDVAAVAGAACDLFVIPKCEDDEAVAVVQEALGRPVYAMIETPRGVRAAADIAGRAGVDGLIMGNNDLVHELQLPDDPGRTGLMLAMQMAVLAARSAGKVALDGVYNRLQDDDGLAAECAQGRLLGFDGKTLIHPNQIATANRIFGPSDDDVAEATAMIAAFTGGAERYQDRMIEQMHIDSARRVLARARRN